MDMIQPEENRSRTITLVEKVMQEIHRRIKGRRLDPGMKLPSIRKFAEHMQVSKSTVVDAYDRLTAEGTITARKGAGFYVAGALPPLSLTELAPKLDRDIDPLWVSRQSLEAEEDLLKPGCGWFPASWMPEDCLRRALRSLSRAAPAALTDYGTPGGFIPLREYLVRRMAGYGIFSDLEQTILTESGTQTIDLLCRFFLEPGDTVLVDDPCYFNFHALLKAHRVHVVSVPYTPTGPDLGQFAEALKTHKPRLYITNSSIHNPTGAILSPATAHGLLKLADKTDLVIIEDDIFADLEVTPAPRLAALDGLQRVVHIGSFSKTLSASARCGFIATRSDWIEGLIDLKIATSFGGNPLAAQLVWHVLKDGSYRKYLTALHERLASARLKTSVRLKEIDIEPWIMPSAGMYLWGRLPTGFEAADIAGKALKENIVLAPGNVFSLLPSASHYLRFNVAQSDSPRIFETLKAILIGRQ
ncbi:MAG: PLP-dependent aminotransferase family protein [Sneathiella sp.]